MAITYCKAAFFKLIFPLESPSVECFLQAERGLRSLRKRDEFGLREDEIEPKASSLGGGRKWAFRRQNPVKSFLAYFEDYFCPAVSLRGEPSRPGQSWIEAVLSSSTVGDVTY